MKAGLPFVPWAESRSPSLRGAFLDRPAYRICTGSDTDGWIGTGVFALATFDSFLPPSTNAAVSDTALVIEPELAVAGCP